MFIQDNIDVDTKIFHREFWYRFSEYVLSTSKPPHVLFKRRLPVPAVPLTQEERFRLCADVYSVMVLAAHQVASRHYNKRMISAKPSLNIRNFTITTAPNIQMRRGDDSISGLMTAVGDDLAKLKKSVRKTSIPVTLLLDRLYKLHYRHSLCGGAVLLLLENIPQKLPVMGVVVLVAWAGRHWFATVIRGKLAFEHTRTLRTIYNLLINSDDALDEWEFDNPRLLELELPRRWAYLLATYEYFCKLGDKPLRDHHQWSYTRIRSALRGLGHHPCIIYNPQLFYVCDCAFWFVLVYSDFDLCLMAYHPLGKKAVSISQLDRAHNTNILATLQLRHINQCSLLDYLCKEFGVTAEAIRSFNNLFFRDPQSSLPFADLHNL